MKRFVAWLVKIVFVNFDENKDGVVSTQEVLDKMTPLAELVAKQLNKTKKEA